MSRQTSVRQVVKSSDRGGAGSNGWSWRKGQPAWSWHSHFHCLARKVLWGWLCNSGLHTIEYVYVFTVELSARDRPAGFRAGVKV